uniref:Uncharacterized protein n=1 Tax=Panagrolaimus superbus TaxID=310955 RepID=A0A914Z5L0_9BILA
MYYYYLYLKIKEECENDAIKRKICFENFSAALNQCFFQINKLCHGDIRKNYLNWIRWNKVNIIVELAYFKDAEIDKNEEIQEIVEKIVALMESNFQLTETEKGVSNEYTHAFDQIQRKEDNFEKINFKLLQHAGRLIINYINHLTQRCYVSDDGKTDRENYDHVRLKSEADYLSTSLRWRNEIQLAKGVEISINNFIEFCELDNAAMIGQERMMKKAIKLAHKRATETFLETVIRKIKERIKEIKEGTEKKMREGVTAPAVLKQAILHPIETLKSFVSIIPHPIKTVKALIKFAKKHPWHLAAIVLGGITIGVASGGVAFAGMAAVHFSTLPLTLPIAALGGIAFGSGAVTSTAVISLGNVGDTIVKINDAEKREIAILEAEKKSAEIENAQKGAQIAADIKFNQIRRETEENIKKFKEFMRNFEKSRQDQMRDFEKCQQDQIDAMSLDELNVTDRELSKDLFELVDEFELMQEETKRSSECVIEIQEKILKIDEGKAAAMWFLQDAKEKYPVPLAESEDSE